MGHDVTDELLDVVNVALDIVQVGQFPLLVLQDLVRLLQPSLEGSHLAGELDELLKSRDLTLDQLVGGVGNMVVPFLQLFAFSLESRRKIVGTMATCCHTKIATYH